MNKLEHGMGYDFSGFLEYDMSSDFTLHEIGSFQCPPGYSYGPCIRARTIVHYIHSGKGTLQLNNKTFHIKEHELFLVPAGISAYYEADSKDPWKYSWFHLSGPILDTVFDRAGLDIDHPVFTPINPCPQMEEAIHSLFINYDQPFVAISKIFEIFHYIINNSSNIKEIKVDSQISFVKNTIRYIHNRYSLNIKVADIAFDLGVNRSYLSRLFKDATGSTIQEYLLAYRMNTATKLLADPKNTVAYVSFAVGYNDAFTFSKAYKRFTGISPSEVAASTAT